MLGYDGNMHRTTHIFFGILGFAAILLSTHIDLVQRMMFLGMFLGIRCESSRLQAPGFRPRWGDLAVTRSTDQINKYFRFLGVNLSVKVEST